MAVKTMDVFQCDAEGCENLAPFGALPDEWIWYLHEYEVATVSMDGTPTPRKVKKADEHEFCSRKHLDAWLKAHGLPAGHIKTWLANRGYKPEAIEAWLAAHP